MYFFVLYTYVLILKNKIVIKVFCNVQKRKQKTNTYVEPQIRKLYTIKHIDNNKIINSKM